MITHEQETTFRGELARIGAEIVDHARDERRDVQTAILQAQQTLGLMLAELRPAPVEPEAAHA